MDGALLLERVMNDWPIGVLIVVGIWLALLLAQALPV